jgi:hypothetical protein
LGQRRTRHDDGLILQGAAENLGSPVYAQAAVLDDSHVRGPLVGQNEDGEHAGYAKAQQDSSERKKRGYCRPSRRSSHFARQFGSSFSLITHVEHAGQLAIANFEGKCGRRGGGDLRPRRGKGSSGK